MSSPLKYAILYVDDEVMSLKYFKEMFEDVAPILVADSPEQALEIFKTESDRIGLVLSDHKMPGMTGIEFLDEVRKINPDPLRVLVTAYADLSTAVDLLNSNLLYSYLSKPWDPEELEGRLVNALDFFTLGQQRDQLLKEKSMAFHQLSIADRANTMNMVSCGLNHHLRNSLNVVSSFFELAPAKIEADFGVSASQSEFWGEFYDEVKVEIDRMIHLLTHFTEASTNNNLEVEQEIDLHEVFQEVAGLIDVKGKEIAISVTQQGEVPLISGDLVKIGQMCRQLFSESVTNIESKGKIEVNIETDYVSGGVRVRFMDDGKPMGDSDLENIFEPFFVRSDNPNELGVDMVGCYLTVHYHGGSMDAKRSPDGKNLIEFFLPKKPIPPENSIELSKKALRFDTDISSVELTS